MIASLDCITKLISHSFFVDDSSALLASLPSPPPSPGPGRRDSQSSISEPSLVDTVVHTITSCHTETSPDGVSLQVVRALLSLVLSQTILVHQSALLKAVRTVYNIFLMSNDPVNQTVAQGGLTQMVNHVFARCKTVESFGGTDRESVADSGVSGLDSRRGSVASLSPDSVPATPLPTGDATSKREGESPQEERNEEGATSVGSLEASPVHSEHPEHEELSVNGSSNHRPLTTKDLFIKDSFLVFRAMCKLTMKPLNTERHVHGFLRFYFFTP
jgi:brefeldin A-inhibited guanine nucleotide-exchange protein